MRRKRSGLLMKRYGREAFLLIVSAVSVLAFCAATQAQVRPAFDSSGVGCSFDGSALTRTFNWQHTIGSGRSRLLVVSVSTTTLDILPVGLPPVPRVVSV